MTYWRGTKSIKVGRKCKGKKAFRIRKLDQDSIGRRRDALWAIHPALVSLQVVESIVFPLLCKYDSQRWEIQLIWLTQLWLCRRRMWRMRKKWRRNSCRRRKQRTSIWKGLRRRWKRCQQRRRRKEKYDQIHFLSSSGVFSTRRFPIQFNLIPLIAYRATSVQNGIILWMMTMIVIKRVWPGSSWLRNDPSSVLTKSLGNSYLISLIHKLNL